MTLPELQGEDPYKDFERIFGTFASAEEVTGQSQPTSTEQADEGGRAAGIPAVSHLSFFCK